MRRVTLLFVCGTLLTTITPAHAQWSTDPAVNLPIATGPAEQRAPQVVSDGAHGALVLYEDTFVGNALTSIVVVKHVLAGGTLDPTWPAGGVEATYLSRAGLNSERLAADGAGGAFVAWTDINSPWNVVRTSHVLANGTLDTAWTVNGAAGVGRTTAGTPPSIVADGTGGAIVTWAGSDSASSNPMWSCSQHLTNDGRPDPAWPAGGRVSNVVPPLNTNDPNYNLWSPNVTLTSVADGRGGAFVFARHYAGYAWSSGDFPSLITVYNYHLTHVNADGSVSMERELGSTLADQSDLDVALLRGGGIAVVMRSESISPLAVRTDFVRLDSNGAPAGGGTALGANGARVASDGLGGAYVVGLLGFPGISAWHLLADGTRDPAWPLAGRVLTAPGHISSSDPVIVNDGPYGAIAAWRDQTFGGPIDLVAQRVQYDGTLAPGWPAGGFAFCTAPGDQGALVAVSDFAHGLIAAWADPRNAGSNDIYAQRVTVPYSLLDAPPEPAALALAAAPNPASRGATFRWSLPAGARVALAVYDAAGRLVRTLVDGNEAAGTGSRAWDLRDDSGARVAAGLYFARFTTPGVERTRRLVVLN